LRHTARSHLIAHDGRWTGIGRSIRLKMGKLGWVLWRHDTTTTGLEASKVLLLRRLGTRRWLHAGVVARRAGDTIFSRPGTFRWNHRVGLIDRILTLIRIRIRIRIWIRILVGGGLALIRIRVLDLVCRRTVAHGTILHTSHLLLIRELTRVEVSRVVYKGGWVHHDTSSVGIVDVREAVSIVVGDGVVHPGAHGDGPDRLCATMSAISKCTARNPLKGAGTG